MQFPSRNFEREGALVIFQKESYIKPNKTLVCDQKKTLTIDLLSRKATLWLEGNGAQKDLNF